MDYQFGEDKFVVTNSPRGAILQKLEGGQLHSTIHEVFIFDEYEDALEKALELDPEFKEEDLDDYPD